MTPSSPAASAASRGFLFLMASARRGGNSEQLARAAAATLPADVAQRWLHLDDVPLASFRDIRHGVGVHPSPVGHERTLADATLASTDLVFVAGPPSAGGRPTGVKEWPPSASVPPRENDEAYSSLGAIRT